MFQCQDKDGIIIICSQGTWDNHIAARHPEMKGYESFVKAAIEKPYQVYQDGRHTNTKIIYRPFILPQPYNQYYLRVVIVYKEKVFRGIKGYVSTAFPCVNIRKGDILIWEVL